MGHGPRCGAGRGARLPRRPRPVLRPAGRRPHGPAGPDGGRVLPPRHRADRPWRGEPPPLRAPLGRLRRPRRPGDPRRPRGCRGVVRVDHADAGQPVHLLGHRHRGLARPAAPRGRLPRAVPRAPRVRRLLRRPAAQPDAGRGRRAPGLGLRQRHPQDAGARPPGPRRGLRRCLHDGAGGGRCHGARGGVLAARHGRGAAHGHPHRPRPAHPGRRAPGSTRPSRSPR